MECYALERPPGLCQPHSVSSPCLSIWIQDTRSNICHACTRLLTLPSTLSTALKTLIEILWRRGRSRTRRFEVPFILAEKTCPVLWSALSWKAECAEKLHDGDICGMRLSRDNVCILIVIASAGLVLRAGRAARRAISGLTMGLRWVLRTHQHLQSCSPT